jgi:DNA polymerase III alpha subunit
MSTDCDVIKGILRHGLSIIDNCVISVDEFKKLQIILESEKLNYSIPKTSIDKNNWFIPESYKNLDIEEFLIDRCPKENYDRLVQELEIYRQKNLIPVLKTIKYIVDIFRQHNIIWGVGRGSSVASYVLFLLDAHRIDSVKYNLPLEEFFKEI